MDLSEIKLKSVGLGIVRRGVKGMAHIGMIQALHEFGINAKAVSGTSVGALVGALYANGNSVPEMLQFFQGNTPIPLSFYDDFKTRPFGHRKVF